MERLKTSYKLYKTIRQPEVSGAGKISTSHLQRETTKSKNIMDEKCKNNKTIACL